VQSGAAQIGGAGAVLTNDNLHFTVTVVIASFRHRGLRRLYEDDDPRGVSAEHLKRIRLILGALDAAERPEDLDVHTFRLHPLKGDLRGFWAITLRANWRIIFRFGAGDARDVDLVDYH